MAKTPTGYLRRPAAAGFMAPQVVLDLVPVVLARLGQAAVDRIVTEAQLHRLPNLTEPVREEKAARLHQAVTALYPGNAGAILAEAGQITADALLATQQSQRAQTMLTGAPWPIAAWLLGRWARQHAWSFAGSGGFQVVNALEFSLTDNPLIRGQTATAPACHWHAAFFGQLFRRLVDSQLECREMACSATGAPACRFVIARS